MADLISREAAISEVIQTVEQHKHEVYRGELLHYTGIKAILEALPAVDAVPVVRCKDCIYWKSNTLTHFWKPCDVVSTDKDWYCPCGRR
jgi:hypothetical protein